MEEAAVMMVGLDIERVNQGLRSLPSSAAGPPDIYDSSRTYSVPNVSDKTFASSTATPTT